MRPLFSQQFKVRETVIFVFFRATPFWTPGAAEGGVWRRETCVAAEGGVWRCKTYVAAEGGICCRKTYVVSERDIWRRKIYAGAEIDFRNAKVQIEERIEVLSEFVSEDVSAGFVTGGSMRRFLLVCWENSNKEVVPLSRTGCPVWKRLVFFSCSLQ